MSDIKVKRGIHSPRQSPAAVLKAFCANSSVSGGSIGVLFCLIVFFFFLLTQLHQVSFG